VSGAETRPDDEIGVDLHTDGPDSTERALCSSQELARPPESMRSNAAGAPR
jgi:hypothetical protein